MQDSPSPSALSCLSSSSPEIISPPPTLEQLNSSLEEEMVTAGINDFVRRENRLVSGGYESQTKGGRQLVSRCIDPLSDLIIKFVVEANNSAGRRSTASAYLEGMDPDVVSLLTVKAIIDGISLRKRVQTIALSLAGAIENEARLDWFDQSNPRLYKRVTDQLKRSPFASDARRKAFTYRHAMRKFGIMFKKWPLTDRVNVGMKLIDLFIEATGLVTVGRVIAHSKKKHDHQILLLPTPELEGFLSEAREKCMLLSPKFMPRLTPPRPWGRGLRGGYDNPRLRVRLVKSRTKGYQKEIAQREMPIVYSAINLLQNTGFKVDTDVLSVVEQAWERNIKVRDMPTRDDPPKPLPPSNMEDPVVARRYKMELSSMYRALAKLKSKRMQCVRTISMASRFAGMSLYFPMSLDFRGRAYCVPSYLNPQGTDLAKGLLTFDKPKVLGASGLKWLMIHVANVYGIDKVSLTERVKWTAENYALVMGTATRPMQTLDWTMADKPYQFLAACIELKKAYCHPDGPEMYPSSLPVTVDGSCNGLQHFAAAMRDQLTGQLVNLVPSDKPNDAYKAVLNSLMSKLERLANDDGTGLEKWTRSPKWEDVPNMARQWMNYLRKDGIKARDLAKRPVMILPYGGTQEAVRKYTLQFVDDNLYERRIDHPFGDQLTIYINFISSLLWMSMTECIPGPREVMSWISKQAGLAVSEGMPLTWSTPSGFLVQQSYQDTRTRRVMSRIAGEAMKVSVTEETDQLDTRQHRQSAAPNVVHSYDGAHLALTLDELAKQGWTHALTNHDSYGAHAANTSDLIETLLDQFITMYTLSDPLEKLVQDWQSGLSDETCAKFAPLPPKGTLNLQATRQAEYPFC